MNLAERGEYFGYRYPQDVAIRDRSTDITWGELASRVARTAHGLAELGVGVGDRVGILGHNSIEWCILALATLHRGAVVVPLNIRLAIPELATIVRHSGCRAVAYDNAFQSTAEAAVADSRDCLRIGLHGGGTGAICLAELDHGVALPVEARSGHDPAVLGYTSGTTGLPKGVILTHGNLAASISQTALSEGSTTQRRTLLCIPLAFTGGIVNNFLNTYGVGGMLVLEPTFDPERVVALLESERITTWFAVPIMWQMLLGSEGFASADLSSLTTAICGGARVPRELLDVYHGKGVVVRQAYGLTEATGSVSISTPIEALEYPESAGRPNVHTRLRLLDDHGQDVAPGDIGELAVCGPQVMAGYWQDEQATAAAVSDGWLLTGDLARQNQNGLLEIVDRKKSMFISGGLNVYPAEIERIVDELPGVAESAAFGIAHDRFGEVCALVVRGVDGPVDEQSVLGHCRAKLADYKVPRQLYQTREPLPRGMSGKLLRNELRDEITTRT